MRRKNMKFNIQIDQKELQKGIQAALDDTDPEDVGISARDAAIAAGIQAAEDDNGDSGGDSGGFSQDAVDAGIQSAEDDI